MWKWRGRNTLDIPGQSDYPVDESAGQICPHCHAKIYILIPIYDPDTKKTKLVCPACGKEV